MFFPLKTDAHDGRFRIGALGIILLCFFVHILVFRDQSNRQTELDRLESQLPQCKNKQQIQDLLKQFGVPGGSESVLPKLEEEESKEKESKEKETQIIEKQIQELRTQSLFYKLALVKGYFNPLNLITSLFTHADWMHLIFNMWFFFLAGVTMEKYWGLGKFIGLYLAFGVLGNLAYLFFSGLGPGSVGVPLVGASGAIAGMMGAFALTHGDAKVKMFWLIGFRGGTFSVSARIYLGFWIAGQVFDAILSSTNVGGVAYSAHIVGFLSGLIAGKVIPVDGFYTKAYKSDPGPKIWDGMVKDEVAGVRGAFKSSPEELTKAREERQAKAGPEASRDSEVMSLLNLGWHTLDQGDASKAADLLFRGIDRAFTIDTLAPDVLDSALRRLLEAMNSVDNSSSYTITSTSTKSLTLPPGALYSWARRMENRQWWQWAIALYDQTAADISGATNVHTRQISLFRAAELRIDQAVDFKKAVAGFNAVIEIDSTSPLAEDARERLASFKT